MKKISLIAFAVAALSASSALAAAGGTYFGLNAGYQIVPGKVKADVIKFSQIDVPPAAPVTANLKGTPKGANVSAAFGYMISDEFRTALSFQYNFDQKNTYNKDSADNSASPKLKISNSWNVLANFYYDFLNNSSFTPFIGVGLGYGSRAYKAQDMITKAPTVKLAGIGNIDDVAIKANSDQTKKEFVFSGTVGAAYKINHQLSLELAYVVQTLPKAETKLAAGRPSADGESLAKFKGKNLSHNVLAGFRFVF